MYGTFRSLNDGSHATFAYGLFTEDVRKKNATKKRKADELSDEDSHRIIVYGDIHSKSNFVKYTLWVTEVNEEIAVKKCGKGVERLYTTLMTPKFYRIERVLKISTYSWNEKNITNFLINRKQNLLKKNLKKLAGPREDAKLFLSIHRVWEKGSRPTLYRDILSAARVCYKSDLYWKVAVYFPPHIVRFCHLQDDEECLEKLYKDLTGWKVPSDVCLYQNKLCWKNTFWETQIQEIVCFWRKQKFFVDAKHEESYLYENGDQLHDFEDRFKIVKYALEQKNLKKTTIFNFNAKFDDFEMQETLLKHNVFYRLEWSDERQEMAEELNCPGLFGTGDLYCFWDDYLEALKLKGLIANRLNKENLYFVQGYPSAEVLQNDVGFVLNKNMQIYVKETLCPEQVYTLSRLQNLKDNHEDYKLNDELTTIWFFGCEYFTIKDVMDILELLKEFKCKVTLHFFGHYHTVHFTAKKFNLLDWFSLSILKDKIIKNITQSCEVLPKEFDIKSLALKSPDWKSYDDEKTADEIKNDAKGIDVIRVAFSKKEKIKESKIEYMLHDTANNNKGTGFYKSIKPNDFGEELLSTSMQVVPNKNIVTNKSFCVGVVNDILYENRSLPEIPRKYFNLNGKAIKVLVKSLVTQETFAPKDLVPSPIISFSEIIYPLRKVALVGEGWPSWAVNAFRNYLCTENLYLAESFKLAEKDWFFSPEESIYTNIINTQMSRKTT